MGQKLTPWFLNGEKPIRDGVYQQMLGTDKTIGYQRFQNGVWYAWRKTPKEADLASSPANIFYQNDPWRGLAEDPNAAMSSKT